MILSRKIKSKLFTLLNFIILTKDIIHSLYLYKKENYLLIKKKEVAIKFLNENNYKKALKLFEKCISLSTSGVFDEDKNKMLPYQLSAQLNISLCHWKMNDW